MDDSTCSIDGCSNPRHAQKMCTKHYQRFRKTGDPTRSLSGVERDRSSRGIRCTVPGCGAKHRARGYCNRHYKRARSTGDPEATPTGRKSENSHGPCLVPGCDSSAVVKRMCHKHYARAKKWGDPLYPVVEKMPSNKGRSECARCGGPLTEAKRSRECVRCRRASGVASEEKRRARMRDAICAHGDGCVSPRAVDEILRHPCVYCGAQAEHLDHLEPLVSGGLHCVENLVSACAPCNIRKGGKDPLDWLVEFMTLAA